MIILGISAFFHDSSACLIKDGEMVAAAEEERFTRKKHDPSFPSNAISYCLSEAGASINDVSYVAYYEKPILKFERVLSQFLETFPKSFPAFHSSMPYWLNEKLRVGSIIKKRLKYRGPVLYIGHHFAHAGSAYLASRFREAAILTVDGVGEWTTTALGHGKDEEIVLLKEIRFPHSLGLLYSAVTAYLGFRVNDAEYKVMGLGAYGKPAYCDNFKKAIEIADDGSFSLDMSYFTYHYKMHMFSQKFVDEFGPPRGKGGEMTERHKDIAASLQKVTEEALFKMLNHLHELTGSDNLCMAGGVALNGVANGKILKNTPFKRIFIQPNASDGGASMGAAMYAFHKLLKNGRNSAFGSAYLGPGYSNEQIETFLDGNGINYSRFGDEKELIEKTARLIYENAVVGWFQGRMEWGPRALGARSILANPCNPGMKDILNLKVKHREAFRPFAPAVCAENAQEYFDCDEPLPEPAGYMLMVYQIRPEKQKALPAVTHVDGSGRLQTVQEEQNPRFHSLIREFGKLSGVPIVVNTSFNIRGEPIVCSPKDAYRCMMGTGIDCLVAGDFLIRREENLKDAWNSEARE